MGVRSRVLVPRPGAVAAAGAARAGAAGLASMGLPKLPTRCGRVLPLHSALLRWRPPQSHARHWRSAHVVCLLSSPRERRCFYVGLLLLLLRHQLQAGHGLQQHLRHQVPLPGGRHAQLSAVQGAGAQGPQRGRRHHAVVRCGAVQGQAQQAQRRPLKEWRPSRPGANPASLSSRRHLPFSQVQLRQVLASAGGGRAPHL